MGFSAALVGSAIVAKQMLSTPDIPKPAAQPQAPQSQAAKTPDAATVGGDMASTGQAGGAPGVAQTMLTGPGGVDPSTLSLGKNTLLGS